MYIISGFNIGQSWELNNTIAPINSQSNLSTRTNDHRSGNFSPTVNSPPWVPPTLPTPPPWPENVKAAMTNNNSNRFLYCFFYKFRQQHPMFQNFQSSNHTNAASDGKYMISVNNIFNMSYVSKKIICNDHWNMIQTLQKTETYQLLGTNYSEWTLLHRVIHCF